MHADGSQGADTKHKVFWVGPCEAPPTNPPGGGGGGGNTVTPPGGGVLAGNPPVRTLPDTSLDGGTAPLTLLAGAALLVAASTLTIVTRGDRSRLR